MICSSFIYIFFFFNDTATTEIYTLSLHDALPIYIQVPRCPAASRNSDGDKWCESRDLMRWYQCRRHNGRSSPRSEEHTSELQSRSDLVCRLLLEKKKKTI